MNHREWLRSGRLQYATLWAVAVACVGLALADIELLGLEPPMLAILAAVFAATTAAYRRKTDCSTA